jgi:hypothetical protein
LSAVPGGGCLTTTLSGPQPRRPRAQHFFNRPPQPRHYENVAETAVKVSPKAKRKRSPALAAHLARLNARHRNGLQLSPKVFAVDLS